MNLYTSKIVFQIICGDGAHAAQFDEQLRLIYAHTDAEALQKARKIGFTEETSFLNTAKKKVNWKFIAVSELNRLASIEDGSEFYSRIEEPESAGNYITYIRQKACEIESKINTSITMQQ